MLYSSSITNSLVHSLNEAGWVLYNNLLYIRSSSKGKNIIWGLLPVLPGLWIASGVCYPWFCLWITSKENEFVVFLPVICQSERFFEKCKYSFHLLVVIQLYLCQICGNLQPNKKSFPIFQWSHPVSGIAGWPVWLSLFTLKATERWEKNCLRDNVKDFLIIW